jgi:hypothetical protein
MANCHGLGGAALGRLYTPARNNYFYGKLMDAAHFTMEQAYFNGKRWLLNRLVTGSGVVCGLAVEPDATDGGDRVVIQPGVAIDRLGREIIVPEARSVAVRPLPEHDECNNPFDGRVWLCLTYHECLSEPAPVLVGDCETMQGCAYGTLCERYRVALLYEEPWRQELGCPDSGLLAFDERGAFDRTALAAWLSRKCPEIGADPCADRVCVPLAVIEVHGDEGMEIATDVRPLVFGNELLFNLLLCSLEGEGPPDAGELTRIEKISWGHDGEMKLDLFQKNGVGVFFSKPVLQSPPDASAWFVVTVEPLESAEGLSLLAPGTVVSEIVLPGRVGFTDDQTAWFWPHEGFTARARELLYEKYNLEKVRCRVALKCDFLLDNDPDQGGQAVDGDFLGGRLPTGDGVPGGEFESWFTLTLKPE